MVRGSLAAQMYGGAGVPQALPLPVQGDVGRQLRVFWTGAEGQQVSGLATVVQEAAGMANVRFTEGGEDRWYTLRKDSMTIAEDGSNFEWTDWFTRGLAGRRLGRCRRCQRCRQRQHRHQCCQRHRDKCVSTCKPNTQDATL